MFFVSCTEFCLLSIGSWYVLLYPARSMSFSHKSHVWLFATPWTVAHQAPLSMGFFQVIILEWVATLQSSQISSVQFSSVTQSCPTLYDPMDRSTPGLPVHHQLLSLLELMSIDLVMPSNHLILCHPLLLPPSIFPSNRVFSNESVLYIRWTKYWHFSLSISPSNEYSGLISFWGGLVGSPCSSRDSQESSPTPQFKSINSLALSLLHSPTLTSIHDHWKNHSID